MASSRRRLGRAAAMAMGFGSGCGSGSDHGLGTSPLSCDSFGGAARGGDWDENRGELQWTSVDHITGCRRMPCTACDGAAR